MTEYPYFDNPYWEPLQVITWMCLRDSKHVHRASSIYLEQYKFNQRPPSIPFGESVRPILPPPLSNIREIDRIIDSDETKFFEFENVNLALEKLSQILQEGKIMAYGVANGIGELKLIEAYKWADLTICWDDVPKHTEAYPTGFSDRAAKWNNLRFERKGVLEIWPDLTKDDSSSKTMSSISTEKNCQKWLIKLMQNNSRRDRTNDQLYSEAKDKFGGLVRRAFDRAKREAVKETGNTNWIQSGPIKKT